MPTTVAAKSIFRIILGKNVKAERQIDPLYPNGTHFTTSTELYYFHIYLENILSLPARNTGPFLWNQFVVFEFAIPNTRKTITLTEVAQDLCHKAIINGEKLRLLEATIFDGEREKGSSIYPLSIRNKINIACLKSWVNVQRDYVFRYLEYLEYISSVQAIQDGCFNEDMRKIRVLWKKLNQQF